MPDSIDSLHGQILDAAIDWADHVEAETKLDERPPKKESNVAHRQEAARKLQVIRTLTKELHDREFQAGWAPQKEDPVRADGRQFCSVHNAWHTFGVNCE